MRIERASLALGGAALAALAAIVASEDGDGDLVPFFVALVLAAGVAAWAVHKPFIGWRRRLARGIGLAWLSAGDDGQDMSLRGFDFAHFLVGLDVRLSRSFGIGPFVDFSVGSYSHREIDTPSGRIDEDIRGRAFHHWLLVGPRFVLLP